MSRDDCELCRGEFEDTVYAEYRFWKVQLHKDQYYLGRSLVKLKRHIVDITNLEERERRELHEDILPELKTILDQFSDPDLYNYASLGNSARHLHFHVIPRYSSKREFGGMEFEDKQWNSHYKNKKTDRQLKNEVFENLRTELENRIEK